jgi:integrase/recombinase XerD
METTIYDILNDMSESLSISQMKKLQEVLIFRLESERTIESDKTDNNSYLDMFITAKQKVVPSVLCSITGSQ